MRQTKRSCSKLPNIVNMHFFSHPPISAYHTYRPKSGPQTKLEGIIDFFFHFTSLYILVFEQTSSFLRQDVNLLRSTLVPSRRRVAVESALGLALDLLFQVRDDGALLHVAVALRRGVDFLSERAEPGRLGEEGR